MNLHESRWWRQPVTWRVLPLLWLLTFVPSALGLFVLSFAVAAEITEVQGTFVDAAELTLGLGVVLAILATGHWWSRRSLARQEQRALPRWPFVPWLVITLVPLMAGVTTKWVRGEDLGTRLRRECASVIREGSGQSYSSEVQERMIRHCIDTRALNAR